MNADPSSSLKWPLAAAAVLTAALVAVLTLGGSAAGLLPASSTSGTTYTLQTVTVDGRQLAARWNPCQRDITYKINVAGVARSERATMTAQIKRGFAQLAAADGLTYRYTGTTTFVPQTTNLASEPAEIVVAAVSRSATDLPLSARALGFGGTLNASWTGHRAAGDGGPGQAGAAVVRGYVVLDAAAMAPLKAGFGPGWTQGNVILHELGHATGLEHASAGHEIMNADLTSADPAGYAAGDQAGLKQVGAGTSCIAIPSSVKVEDLS